MKGQNIATMTIFVLVFLISGNLVVSIASTSTVEEKIQYSIGDFNTLASAKMRGEIYNDRMDRELTYSSNYIALESDTRTWNSIPSESALRSDYENSVVSEVNTQAGVEGGCSAPSVSSVSSDEEGPITGSLEGNEIMCSDTNVDKEVVSRAWIKVDRSLEAVNERNRFVNLKLAARDIATEMQENLPESWESGSGSDSECSEDPDQSEVRENAKDEAREDAIQDESLASTVLSSDMYPEWVSVETGTEFSVSYSQEDYSSEDCAIEVEVMKDIDDDGEDEETTEIDEDGGTEITYEYSADVTQATLSFDLSDSERQVLATDGNLETVDFSFNYPHSLN